MLWENLREEEFKEAIEKSNGVCIIPIGSLEKHGQHLPLGMDSLVASVVCELAAETEYAVVFPTIYVGDMIGSTNAGEVSYSPELLMMLLRETCSEIHKNGFDKIIVVSGHGGNLPFISFLQRAFNADKLPYTIFDCRIECDYGHPKVLLEKNYDYLTDEDKEILQDFVDKDKDFGHACFIETGWMYAIRPETVRLDKIHDEDASSTHLYDEFLKNDIIPANWWIGNWPTYYQCDIHDGMNERIAKAMLEATVEKLASQIKFIKEEEVSRKEIERRLGKK